MSVPIEHPGVSCSTSSRLMPRCGGVAVGSVTTSTTSGSAWRAWVIIVFVPVTT